MPWGCVRRPVGAEALKQWDIPGTANLIASLLRKSAAFKRDCPHNFQKITPTSKLANIEAGQSLAGGQAPLCYLLALEVEGCELYRLIRRFGQFKGNEFVGLGGIEPEGLRQGRRADSPDIRRCAGSVVVHLL